MPYSDLTTTIQTAVKSALESTDISTADLNLAIQKAIENALKAEGDSTSSDSSDSTVSRGEFAQMLDSYGISREQFQNDLKEAFQNTQGVNVAV
jgi:hypothetical protein